MKSWRSLQNSSHSAVWEVSFSFFLLEGSPSQGRKLKKPLDEPAFLYTFSASSSSFLADGKPKLKKASAWLSISKRGYLWEEKKVEETEFFKVENAHLQISTVLEER